MTARLQDAMTGETHIQLAVQLMLSELCRAATFQTQGVLIAS